jgi:hypothetical protein
MSLTVSIGGELATVYSIAYSGFGGHKEGGIEGEPLLLPWATTRGRGTRQSEPDICHFSLSPQDQIFLSDWLKTEVNLVVSPVTQTAFSKDMVYYFPDLYFTTVFSLKNGHPNMP